MLKTTLDYTSQDAAASNFDDDRPPSPVYRNGGQYSPPVSDLSDRCSPHSTTSSTTMNLKSPAAASDVSATEGDENHHHVMSNITTTNTKKTHFDFDDSITAMARGSMTSEDLISQSISSGRRKGRPKKHVREDQPEEGNNDKDEIEVEETECKAICNEVEINNHHHHHHHHHHNNNNGRLLSSSSVASGLSTPPPLSSISPTKTSSCEQQQQHLTVEIPDRTTSSSPNREHSTSDQKSPLPPSPRSCASVTSFPSSSPTTITTEEKSRQRNCSGSVEEYPVMIIRDPSEDSRMQVCHNQ